nr:FAD-binding protein [uncultured Blautia sp.]
MQSERNIIYDVDVVILGSGAAGMMAGITTAEAGHSCVILEKGKSIVVSNAARSGGPALADTRYQQEVGAVVSSEQLYRHMYSFSRGTVHAGLLRNAVEKGARVEDIFRRNQIELELLPDTYGVGFRARHMFKEGGARRWGALMKDFENMGGMVSFGRAGVKLIISDGRVQGVLAKDVISNGKWYEYRARAVLIATGGYLGDQKMIQEHSCGVYVNALGSKLSDGTGIRMALEAGGVEDRNWGICANEFGGANQKIKKEGRAYSSSLRYAVYGGLLVNGAGRRFMNEQYLSDKPLSIGGEIILREGKFYAVIDRDMYEGLKSGTVYDYYGRPKQWHAGRMTHDMPSRFREIDLTKDIEEGWACCEESLEKAGAYFGLKHLTETVIQGLLPGRGCRRIYLKLSR